MEIHKLRFPIGKFECPEKITAGVIKDWIEDFAYFPKQLLILCGPLSKEELNWKYRSNGWTVKQVIHHCADSHMNSFIRFKLALTEDTPKIKPYYEDRWAELTDGNNDDIRSSLLLLNALHQKWVRLLSSLTAEELEKAFLHPETNSLTQLKKNIGIYSWHGKHHLAHIELALLTKGSI